MHAPARWRSPRLLLAVGLVLVVGWAALVWLLSGDAGMTVIALIGGAGTLVFQQLNLLPRRWLYGLMICVSRSHTRQLILDL